MLSVMMIGRWSEESAVMVLQEVWLVSLCFVIEMSGEEGCWLFAVGSLVGRLVLSVV